MATPSQPTDATGQLAKRTLADLAVFGGRRAFARPLHVGAPNIGSRAALVERIDGALERRWLANEGQLVQEFESRLADTLGVAHCLAVSNATAGIQIMAKALELRDEVILPAFTFIGTAQALRWVGLKPVFCDIDADSHTISPSAAARAVTPRTSAILGVHLWGRPCRIDALADVASDHGVALMFDGAHALGCSYKGEPLGRFGAAEVFSFHATKMVSAGEGGAITTNDDDLAYRMRLLRNFGFSGYDDVSAVGINAKMSELSAAMGLTSLEAFDYFASVNARNYAAYATGLADTPDVRLIHYAQPERHNYHYVVLELLANEEKALARDDLISVLQAENVLARRYFYPGCHRMKPYRHDQVQLPVTDAVAGRVVTLPTGTAVSTEAITTVCSIIDVALRHGEEIALQLRSHGAGR